MGDIDNKIELKPRGKVYFTDDENLYLPSVAKNCGYDVKVNSSRDIQKIVDSVMSYSPDYLVAEITFAKFRVRFEILAKIKELLPKVKIIVTGNPFLTYNTNVTYENPFIDYVIVGETEVTLKEILDGYSENEILGICYTDDNMQAVKNEARPFIENLDSLPYSAINFSTNKEAVIEVSRGCPYQCVFCISGLKNGIAHRTRTPQSILSEIDNCIKKYGIKHFYFKADNFNFDVKWVENLCNTIIESGIKINWSCDLVPKNVDNKLCGLMYKAGLRYCKLGIESGSKEILSKLDKDVTIESIKETVKALKKYRIKTTCYYIFGLPWETEESAKETIEFSISLNSDNAVFNTAVPLPGTKFFVYSMLNRLFSAPPQFIDGEKLPLARTHKLTRERIFELRNLAEKRYYSRPKYIIKRMIKSILHIFNL